MKLGIEPPDHAIGRSRGGLTSKLHMATDGKGRMLSAVLTAGNINDTTMMAATLEEIRVPRPGRGRPRTRPDRVLADKGYTSKANRSWLAERGIKATIPEKSDQAANRKRRAPLAGARQRSMVRPTRGATSSNGDSIDSRTGGASR